LDWPSNWHSRSPLCWRLGGWRVGWDQAHAIRIAYDGIYGFSGVDAAIDRAGYSALVRDREGRHVLIMVKGNKFVTRIVTPPIEGRLDHKLLTIDLREPDCAPVTLNLGDKAQYWASGLRHIPVGKG
jgi:hypothetical protein